MDKRLNKIVKVLIVAGMILGAAGCISGLALGGWPGVTTLHLQVNGDPAWHGIASGILAALAILGGEWIGWTLLQMMRSLEQNPFVLQNVIALRNMGFTALGIMVCGLLTLLFRMVPLLVFSALPIGLCGLFSLVLSNVFSKAVAYKEENDLTV